RARARPLMHLRQSPRGLRLKPPPNQRRFVRLCLPRQVEFRSLGGWRIVSQGNTSHAPGTSNFVAVLVPIITTPEINVVERRAVRLVGHISLAEGRARVSELAAADAGLWIGGHRCRAGLFVQCDISGDERLPGPSA